MNPYPKRPKYFANKVCRLLTKKTAANEIGASACWLLTVIAMTEDARGYTDPVTYYNEQLAPLVGVGSVDALDNIRKKAIQAGWLNYEPGWNRRPGKYYVAIPERFNGTDDAPSDEGDAANLRENTERSTELDAANLRENTGDHAERTPRITRSEVRNLLPVPSPVPIPAVEAPAVALPAKRKAKTSSKAKKARARNPLFDAIVEVTGADPGLVGSRIGKVAATLCKAEPPYTPDEVREFGKRFLELCSFARGSRTRPEIGDVQNHLGKLRTHKLDQKPTGTKPLLNPSTAAPAFQRTVVKP